jgi:hypothetical protein
MIRITFERLFSMSAFEGLRLIRKEFIRNPSLDIENITHLLYSLEPITRTLDIEASTYLHEVVAITAAHDGDDFYRECISALIIEELPGWAKLITLGRKRFIQKLSTEEFRDVKSLFRQAQLLNDPATSEDIKWWDHVSGRVRLEGDRLKLERGRKAEQLTLQFETQRLLRLGIETLPKWVAIEDNTAGYDVLSYEIGEFGLLNKLIEVKSTIASPLRFFITRNEWNHALEIGDAYIFHIWDLQPVIPILYVKKASDIAPHIPQDNLKGKWTLAEIPVSVSK